MLFYIAMEKFLHIPINDISVNPYQPRSEFSTEKLTELSKSIIENGLIQPIIVRKSQIFGYELLAGERRLRASKLAGLTEIPAIVKELTDQEMMLQSIIENLQRDDLSPLEEAKSYQTLIDKGMTHDDIAIKLGKSRPYISNLVRLLKLSKVVQIALNNHEISQAHARLLVPFSDYEQEEWLQKIIKEDLSVHQLESLTKIKKVKKKITGNPFQKEMESKLKKILGLPVSIRLASNQSGSVTIHFKNQEEFNNIINSLK